MSYCNFTNTVDEVSRIRHAAKESHKLLLQILNRIQYASSIGEHTLGVTFWDFSEIAQVLVELRLLGYTIAPVQDNKYHIGW